MNPFFKFLSQNFMVIILVLGIVIAVNIFSIRYHYRWDLTDEKEYTLADSSHKILQRLEDQLTIKLYYSKDLPAQLLPIQNRVADIISEFKANSKQSIRVEHVDPDLNEEREQETLLLGIVPLQLNVIERDKQEVRKAYMGMALYYQDKRQVIPVVTEVQNMEYLIDLSILNLTQKEKPKIGVFIGANQSKYRLIDEIVKQLGVLVPIEQDVKDLTTLGLNTLIVVDPVEVKKEFVNQWDTLLEKGVHILIFTGALDVGDDLNPTEVLSGTDDWLEDKGVSISGNLLLDIEQNAQAGFNTGLVQVYMVYPFWVRALKPEMNKNHIITTGLEEVLFPWSNTLALLNEQNNPWKVDTLIESSKKSFLQPEEVPNADPQYIDNMTTLPTFKQYPLSVALHKNNEKTGQIFITATHHLLQDAFLQRSEGNVVFLTNMLEYASWGDYLIGIRSRGKTARPLKELSATQTTRIKWGITLAIPVGAIILGLLALALLKKRRQRLIESL